MPWKFPTKHPEVGPVGDPVPREVFQPVAGRVCQEQGKVANDELVILRSPCSTREAVIIETQAGIHITTIFGDVCRGSVP